jgi:hypothetical protein
MLFGVMPPSPSKSAPETGGALGKPAARRDGSPLIRPFHRGPAPGRTVSTAPSFRPGRTLGRRP